MKPRITWIDLLAIAFVIAVIYALTSCRKSQPNPKVKDTVHLEWSVKEGDPGKSMKITIE